MINAFIETQVIVTLIAVVAFLATYLLEAEGN